MASKQNCKDIPKVLIVNGESQSGTALYRAFAAEKCLKEIGMDVEVVGNDSLEYACLDNVAACLFVRTPLSPAVSEVVEKLKFARAAVIADFDDLVFCPELLHLWDGMNYLADKERKDMASRAYQYQQMVKVADCVIGTTLPLSEELSRYNKNVRVIKNYPLDFARSISAPTKGYRSSMQRFVVAYYPGTMTHQSDFKQCAKALSKFMRQHRAVDLRIVGQFNIDEFSDFDVVRDRVNYSPFMTYNEMLLDMSQIDVNIAPLQLGNRFCECKSPLKYFDAGLMCVPTIATPTQPFRTSILNGVNGFLAGNMQEWSWCLENLLRDRNLPNLIGLNARRYVLSYFGKAAQISDYRNLMNYAVKRAELP